MPQENASRLTAFLLQAAIKLHAYCFVIFESSQTISDSSLQKEFSIRPARKDTERLDNLHYQYTYAAKMPSIRRVYVGLTANLFNETVRS